MKALAQTICAKFTAIVSDTSVAEKSAYYAVQRDMLAAAATACPDYRSAFVRVANLAGAMGGYLEDDAIAADHLVLWVRYSHELVRAIRAVGDSADPGQAHRVLDACEAIILPLRGAP